jgi:NADH pyrophosphatase NudC (nudix superfamily)
MKLEPNVFDVWTFRRTPAQVEYLLLHTSQYKADRYFNGGRFWQIPSGFMEESERVVPAIQRLLSESALAASGIWAAEHVYNIYNRRFETIQMIAVYAAEVGASEVRLDPKEHAEYRWCGFDEALELVNYRGLKEGLRSTREYVTGIARPWAELRLL